MSGYDPARYAPGTPWATHAWLEDLHWADSAVWCGCCGTASFKDEAHKLCPGPVPAPSGPPSMAVLVASTRR